MIESEGGDQPWFVRSVEKEGDGEAGDGDDADAEAIAGGEVFSADAPGDEIIDIQLTQVACMPVFPNPPPMRRRRRPCRTAGWATRRGTNHGSNPMKQ